MAGEFNNYVLQQRPIQPLLDLGVVQNTLATITAGNKEALQKQSELRAAIANLDLNEAEEGYKQQLYDDITKTIDDNSIEGNAYYALDDIIKKQGDISSNEGLIGRVKAQQAYKTFQAQLDDRVAKGDISADTAEWAKELNPYEYHDNYKKDEQGNDVLDANGNKIVIGGSTWLPKVNPTSDIDFNEVFKAITKELVPEQGGWSGTRNFIYTDGTYGNVFKPGETVDILDKATNQYTRLTADRIQDAIQSAFQNNPQLAAQAKQAYDVLIWKANKGKIKPSDENGEYNGAGGIFNADGSKKTYNQYMVDMVDGYARTRAYNNRSSSVEYNSSGIARQYDISHQIGRFKRSGNSDVPAAFGNPAKNGYYEVSAKDYVNDYNNGTRNVYQQTQSVIKKTLSDLGYDIKEDITSIEQIDNIVGAGPLTAEKQKKYNDLMAYAKPIFEMYKGDFEALQNSSGPKGTVSDGANEILGYLTGCKNINHINITNPTALQAREQYGAITERVFGEENLVGFRFKSNTDLQKFINANGGDKALTSLGYHIEGNNVYIDKENSHLLYSLTDSLNDVKGDYWRSSNGVPKGSGSDITGGALWYGMQSYGGSQAAAAGISREVWTKNGFERMFRNFGSNLSEMAQKDVTARDEEQQASVAYLPNYRLSSWSSFNNEVGQYEPDIEGIVGTKGKKELDTAAQQTYIDVKNGQHHDETIRVFDNDGYARIIDGPTKHEILEELQAIKDSDGRGYADIIDGLGARYAIEYRISKKLKQSDIDKLRNQGAQVIETDETEGGKKTCIVKRNIVLDYYENDDVLTYYNNLPIIQNSRRPVAKYLANSNYYFGGGTGDQEYSATPYKTTDLEHQWSVNIGGSPTGVLLNNKDVQDFENMYFEIMSQRGTIANAIAQLKDKSQAPNTIAHYCAQKAAELYKEYDVPSLVFNSQQDFINYIMRVLNY